MPDNQKLLDLEKQISDKEDQLRAHFKQRRLARAAVHLQLKTGQDYLEGGAAFNAANLSLHAELQALFDAYDAQLRES